VSLGDFSQTDFCSKVSDTIDGSLRSWSMYRDLRKVLVTKQHTNSRNMQFLFRPEVYLAANLYALKLEKLSSLVECIREVSLAKLTGGQKLNLADLHTACKPYMYTLNYHSSSDYKFESSINFDLGITNATFYDMCLDNTLYAGKSRSEEEGAELAPRTSPSVLCSSP